jgi:uncharacterized protein (TIGR03382 family)
MRRTLAFLVALVVIGPPTITWGQDRYAQQPAAAQDSSQSLRHQNATATDATADPAMPNTASDIPLVGATGLAMLGAGAWLSRRRHTS